MSNIERYMRLPRACEYLGMTEGEVRYLVEVGRIPYAKRGRRLIFDRAKLDAWVEEGELVSVETAGRRAS